MIKERNTYIIITIQSVAIVVLLILLVFSFADAGRVAELEKKLAESGTIVQECVNRNDSLSLLLQEYRVTGAVPPFLNNRQIEDLQKKGLSDPIRDLREDLAAAPGIIGSPAVLGGTMGFYYMDGIHILNKRWVFAYFEDGHLAGAMLLSYEIGDEGEISWEVLDEIIY